MDPQLIALYEIKRQTFLLGYVQNPNLFSPALAYAYYHRMVPIFHEAIARDDVDPFDGIYSVKADFIEQVTRYIDERDLAGDLQAVEFYKLETRFCGHHVNRADLIRSLEYTRIDGRFGSDVWAAVESNAPTEASSLRSTFSPRDVHFA